MKHSFRIGCTSLGLLLLLAVVACAVPLPGRPLLSVPPDGNTTSPTTAVEANGTRHFAWSQPGVLGPGITYYRVLPDGTTASTSWYPADLFTSYRSPQLAVTTSGTAYVVYESCSIGTFTDCVTNYVTFPKAWGGTAPPAPVGVVNHAGLILVNRGEWLYVLGGYGDAFIPTSSKVFYAQIAGGTRKGDVVSFETNWFASSPSAAIDSSGNLHVAFLSCYTLACTSSRIGYTSDPGTGGDMPAPVYTATTSNELSSPAFSLSESAGSLYAWVAYAARTAPSHEMYLWPVKPLPADAPTPIPLGFATDWQIFNLPALAAFGAGSYQVVLSASNNARTDAKMWLFSGSGSVIQLTNDDVNEGQPLAAKLNAYFLGKLIEFPIFAWRTAGNPVAASPGNCFGDVRVLTESSGDFPVVRTAFHDQGTCGNFGYDLAGGDQALGVWLDHRAGSTVLEPFYSAAAVEMFVPVIRR